MCTVLQCAGPCLGPGHCGSRSRGEAAGPAVLQGAEQLLLLRAFELPSADVLLSLKMALPAPCMCVEHVSSAFHVVCRDRRTGMTTRRRRSTAAASCATASAASPSPSGHLLEPQSCRLLPWRSRRHDRSPRIRSHVRHGAADGIVLSLPCPGVEGLSAYCWVGICNMRHAGNVFPAQSSSCAFCCLYRLVLEGPRFQDFFDKVEVANFEVASDAFTTFKVREPSCACGLLPAPTLPAPTLQLWLPHRMLRQSAGAPGLSSAASGSLTHQ